MSIYRYSGPILRFERIVTEKWTGVTDAPSKQKAINNLKFRAKKDLGLTSNAHIDLISKYFEELK